MIKNESRFISLVSDTTFKYLFKSEYTRYYFEEIILNKTGIDLSKYNLSSEEDNTGNKIRDYRRDVVLIKNKHILIIEMNKSNRNYEEIKSRYYVYRVAGNNILSKDIFSNSKKISLIMFNNFYCSKNRNIDVMRLELSSKKRNISYNDFEIYEIFLPIYYRMCYHMVNKIDKRLYLFSVKSFEEMEKLVDNKDDKKILKELKSLSMNDMFFTEYERELIEKKTIKSIEIDSEKRGERRGIQRSLNETAKKMLKDGLDTKIITKYTSLSEKQINNLK